MAPQNIPRAIIVLTLGNKVILLLLLIIKPQSFESRRNSSSSFFLPGVDASHVYVRALALGCFYSHISTGTFRRALTASLDSCAEKKTAPSGVTKSSRVWRKVPESDARSARDGNSPRTNYLTVSVKPCRQGLSRVPVSEPCPRV